MQGFAQFRLDPRRLCLTLLLCRLSAVFAYLTRMSTKLSTTMDAMASALFPNASMRRPAKDLLAVLPEAEWARWLPQLESVDMPLGEVLFESGGAESHLYFPTTAIVYLLYVLENGS